MIAGAGIPYSVEGPDGPLFADFHALRHSYITALGRGGVDLRTAQELAGHSTPVLTARYSHRRLHAPPAPRPGRRRRETSRPREARGGGHTRPPPGLTPPRVTPGLHSLRLPKTPKRTLTLQTNRAGDRRPCDVTPSATSCYYLLLPAAPSRRSEPGGTRTLDRVIKRRYEMSGKEAPGHCPTTPYDFATSVARSVV
jgi:hypothetical protein